MGERTNRLTSSPRRRRSKMTATRATVGFTQNDVSSNDVGVQQSAVQRFYAGGVVFVTGATGFMGKVLVEKLLWSCPDVDAIYLLVRSKKGKTGQERIDDLVGSSCFDRLRRERGLGFKAKLLAVQGDITEEGLGMRAHDCQLLAERVTVVFHVAATVRFDEQLNQAVKQNVRGTRDVLALCRTFTQLKAVVHVSTAYANCPYEDIEERFYESPLDCDQAIEMAEKTPPERLTAITPKLLGKWPNTYAFTKAIAENVVQKHGQGLPIGVFRPAIVVCSVREPEPGWVDTVIGPGGIIAGIYAGYIRVMRGDNATRSGFVPCDMAINGIIASAWDVVQHRAESDEIPFYNFTPSPRNTLTWGNYVESYRYHLRDIPSSRAFRSPDISFVSSRVLLFVYRVLFHLLPALVADGALLLTGTKPRLVKLYGKIHMLTDLYYYFVSRDWNFEEKNLPKMWARLEERDKVLFNYDMRSLDWDMYCKHTSPGVRKFMAEEDPESVPAARIRLRRIQLFVATVNTAVYWSAAFFIFSKLVGYASS